MIWAAADQLAGSAPRYPTDSEPPACAAPSLYFDGVRAMSNEITRAIWKLHGIPATTKFVFISLGDQADKNGRCWPSVRHTATRTGLSERTVQNAIAWLVDAGLVAENSDMAAPQC